jgi:hypothetical protein
VVSRVVALEEVLANVHRVRDAKLALAALLYDRAVKRP